MGKKTVGRKSKSEDHGDSKKGNNGEKDKDGMNPGGSERVLRSRSVTKGGPNADEKGKGKKPMVDGKLNRGDANADEKAEGKKPMVDVNSTKGEANADEKTRKKTPRVGGNLTINDEVAQKGGGNEKGNLKKVSGDRDWILKPHNPRQGDGKISEKAKGKRKVMAEEENDEGPVSPAKRKKPDEGMRDPNASSAERGAYNLRSRKAEPSFQRLGLSESGFALVVGKRVKVYKSGSRKWVTGTINSYNDTEKLHNVVYVDGESEELDLKSQRFEVEVTRGEASTLCAKQKPNVNPKSRKTKKKDSGVRSEDLNMEMEKSYEESEVVKVSQNKNAAKPRQKLVTNAGKKSAGDRASASKSKRSQKMKKDEGKKSAGDRASASKSKRSQKMKKDEGEDKESSEEGATNSDSSK